MYITTPESIAELFNEKVPGAYRKVIVNDIRLMTKCGLIGKFRYYVRQDLETVRGVLQYEKLRENPSIESGKGKPPSPCKKCGKLMPPLADVKLGRPKEYCDDCKLKRGRDR